jgi:predicted amidohydrolase YtcJ
MARTARLYFGGDVYTLDRTRPRAQAVAVTDGRIRAVGEERDCRQALGADFEAIDLRGQSLLPGFCDTHLHPIMMIYFAQNADLSGVRSISALQARLREAAGRAAEDAWVVGLQFDDEALDEPRLPTRHQLDDASPERPVVIVTHDGHMLIGNTSAIRAAGVSSETGDPPGGVIDREEGGFPAGPFRENAAQLLLSAMPGPDLDSLKETGRSCFARLASQGITSIGAVLQTDHEGPGGEAASLEFLAMQLLLEDLPLSLYCMGIGGDFDKVQALRQTPLHDPAAGRQVAGYKIFSDGTLGSCTACMMEPFSDQPERSGFMMLEDDEIYRRMLAGHVAGFQICVHAIGDRANRRCIELYERLLAEHPREDHRHRIEHASLLDPESIAAIARLGLVVSTQPLFIHSEKGWLHRRIGQERARSVYPFRALVDAGVTLAGASDAPVESTDVLHAIQCCVTREGFEEHQALSADEALRMFTLNAAYVQHQEDEKGSITPGKRADLVVLSANPVDVDPRRIREIRVQQTVVNGLEIYPGPS